MAQVFVRPSRAAWASALGLLATTCAGGEPPRAPSAESAEEPSWCEALTAALGGERAGLRCLPVPNALVTGAFGPRDRPGRSDLVSACFGGDEGAAARLRLTSRSTADVRLELTRRRSLDADGRLDLAFLGPWAPALSARAATRAAATVRVELRDAELRVLSSAGEALGLALRAAPPAGDAERALEPCVAALCDVRQGLVYTVRTLAAVPVITVELDSGSMAGLELTGGAAGVRASVESKDARRVVLTAQEKLNVAAEVAPAAAALASAGTCAALAARRGRRELIQDLHELTASLLARRGLERVPRVVASWRERLRSSEAVEPGSVPDLLVALEALEAAARALAPEGAREACTARAIVERALTSPAAEGPLHATVVEALGPLHAALGGVANAAELQCADAWWFADDDADGFGDPARRLRAAVPPAGHVPNSLDCFDRNAEARPGQQQRFEQHRGDGSFDYDCDGQQTPEDAVVAGGCQSLTTFGVPTRCWAEAGWIDAPPACGAVGRRLEACATHLLSCEPDPTARATQRCR
ncbi:MAG: hypothetical protein IT376_16815 [Polyangiaceae bacterium]|nr:hypothetical protein [Polyangiaceae bacterium]